MTFRPLFLLSLFAFATPLSADDWPQFRGPDRTGISKEKGLRKEWPKGGPKLLWTYKDAGVGFSCPIIIGDMLYTMGGFDKEEFVLAIDMKENKEKWRAKVGPLFSYNNWGDGPRSSPTVAGDLIYALGGHGDLVCVDKVGKEKWRKSFAKDLGGVMMSDWGFSESVLIDGDNLICTPGGDKGTLACLDKFTGKELWRSKALTNKAPYSSVMVGTLAGVRQYVQTSYIDDEIGGVISGFDVANGSTLWSAPILKGMSYAISPTPILQGDLVYVTSGGSDGRCHCFQITKTDGGLKAKNLYDKATQKKVKNNHGGVVLVGGKIYGHTETQTWFCQELETGEIQWSDREQHSTKSGSIVTADGMLYLLTEDGTVVLAEPDPKKFAEVSSFPLPETSALRAKLQSLQAAKVWTNPVIANGRLYLRDQELIFCFDVKK